MSGPQPDPSSDRPVGRPIGKTALSKEQVREMRRERRNGVSLPALARKYGVHFTTIAFHCRGIRTRNRSPFASLNPKVKKEIEGRQNHLLAYLQQHGGCADARDLRAAMLATGEYSVNSLQTALRQLKKKRLLLRYSIGAGVVPVNRRVVVYALAEPIAQRVRYPLSVLRLLQGLLVREGVPQEEVRRHLSHLHPHYDLETISAVD